MATESVLVVDGVNFKVWTAQIDNPDTQLLIPHGFGAAPMVNMYPQTKGSYDQAIRIADFDDTNITIEQEAGGTGQCIVQALLLGAEKLG